MKLMKKEPFQPFEDDSYDLDDYGNETGPKRRKPRPHWDELKEDLKKTADRERRRHEQRKKARREKNRMDWDEEE